MAERVAGACPRNRHHDLAVIPGVFDDDVRLTGFAFPLQRNSQPVALACLQFNKHGSSPVGVTYRAWAAAQARVLFKS